MAKNKKKVFVAMSGGVDSSVAALLLKKRGYDVVGVFMHCYNIDGCAERDSEDARRVAEKIGIPFYVWDFEAEYKNKVVDYMIEGYKRGETPNPDVMCNREIKFGLFFERALQAGADYIATGHYVRIRKNVLFRAKDENKDQSYFLWTLTPNQLKHCLFPIGDYLKPEVREIARKAGLPTAEKKDSQGICFLGKVSLVDFLKLYIPEKPGPVLDLAGRKIGEHQGAHFYTIGQRQGIGNVKHQKGIQIHAPLYVAEKDVDKNTIVVAESAENPALYRQEINLRDVNFLQPANNKKIKMAVYARVRYRQPLAEAELVKILSSKSETWSLIFKNAQKFVAPGQSAVFYSSKGELLGGGVIV